MTISSLGEFQETIRQHGAGDVIIDLEEVPYIDSTGLGAILGCWSHAQSKGKRFALVGMSQRVKTVFDITRTIAVVPIFANSEQAERSFRIATDAIRVRRSDGAAF